MSPGDTKNPSAEESTPPETARSWTRRWLFDPDRSVRAFVERSCQEARALVGEIGLDEIQQKIVRSRWVEQGRMYEAVWRRQRFAYRLLRIPIIIGAATLPVLVSLSADKTTTALIGLGVAILTGLDSFLQLGPRWQQHRQAAPKIGFEGWQFAALAGPYSGKGRAAAYLEFMTNLERLNQSLESTYFELFKAEASKPPDRDVPANDHAGTRKERDEDDDAGATDT